MIHSYSGYVPVAPTMQRYTSSYSGSCEPLCQPIHNQSPAYLSQDQSHCSPSLGFPRSASEALFDTSTKFRQLPCRTFISVGTCPYRERCVYLHDPRCICREAKTKTRRKNKEDVVLDSLFWPVMPYSMVAAKLDSNRQPHVIQPYAVPLPQVDQYRRHDQAVYSMWMHFVDCCEANNDSNSQQQLGAGAVSCYSAPDLAVNSYTGQRRLSVFRALSLGHFSAGVTAREGHAGGYRQRTGAGWTTSAPVPVPVAAGGAPLVGASLKAPSPVTVAQGAAFESPLRQDMHNRVQYPPQYPAGQHYPHHDQQSSPSSNIAPMPQSFRSIWGSPCADFTQMDGDVAGLGSAAVGAGSAGFAFGRSGSVGSSGSAATTSACSSPSLGEGEEEEERDGFGNGTETATETTGLAAAKYFPPVHADAYVGGTGVSLHVAGN